MLPTCTYCRCSKLYLSAFLNHENIVGRQEVLQVQNTTRQMASMTSHAAAYHLFTQCVATPGNVWFRCALHHNFQPNAAMQQLHIRGYQGTTGFRQIPCLGQFMNWQADPATVDLQMPLVASWTPPSPGICKTCDKMLKYVTKCRNSNTDWMIL